MFNILSPQDMDELLFSPFQQALGQEHWERIQRSITFYEYYEGKQHIDPQTGRLVRARELSRPPGLDYDPTRYATNYFKVFIDKKASWQMSGKHTVHVLPKQIDDPLLQAQPDYTPSPEQQRENERARGYEQLLRQLWKENRMNEQLIQAARDRLIAGNVGIKIAYNPRTGRIHWIFRPDYEIVPVYSDDDFKELIACHFVHQREDEDGKVLLYKQTFSMENGVCFVHEAVYDSKLNVVQTIMPKTSLGIDFIPVVLVPVQELVGSSQYTEPQDMKEQTDILNQMNEDAIDSLKFEMFSMTALINVPEGVVDKVKIAPGAVIEATGTMEGLEPQIKKIEGGFRWKDAFKDQYARVKGALHEITSIPQIVPQELNFGGLNGEALHVLFHSIIQETEEHWVFWQSRLQELHEKTVRYLQARLNHPAFAYDRNVVRAIGNDYDSEIKFVLPLPENRKELVALLTAESAAGFESIAGAMRRLGVEHPEIKKKEILSEKRMNMSLVDPYALEAQTGEELEEDAEDEETVEE